MITTTRRSKSIAIMLLLAAGTASLTGCSALSAVGLSGATQGPTLVAGVDPSTATVQPEFAQAFGPQVPKQVTTLGLQFIEVAHKDFPDYTNAGFKQTQDNWIKTVGARLNPLLSKELLEKEASTWTAGEQGVLFAVQSSGDRSIATSSGQLCHLTDSDPIESSVGKPEVAGSGPATFSAPVSLTFHCQEGKTAAVTLKYDLEMSNYVMAGQSKPDWHISSWHRAPVGEVTMS